LGTVTIGIVSIRQNGNKTMSLAFCVYDLTVDVDGALNVFAKIVDHLGLSEERVIVEGPKHSSPTRMPIDRFGPVNSLFSGMRQFSFAVYSGEPLEATLHNAAPYVEYSRVVSHDSLTVFSPQQVDLRDFAERFMGGVPGKYGFGMDWNRPGSFAGYAYGIEDFESTGGDFFGTSDAGRWGNLYLPNMSRLFDRPIIRDIYPVNLLTNAQLDRETRDGTVRDLILGHKDWGEVAPLADNWFLWWVPSREIDAVREDFQSRGLLENRVGLER
jgi:hypothetical protein